MRFSSFDILREPICKEARGICSALFVARYPARKATNCAIGSCHLTVNCREAFSHPAALAKWCANFFKKRLSFLPRNAKIVFVYRFPNPLGSAATNGVFINASLFAIFSWLYVETIGKLTRLIFIGKGDTVVHVGSRTVGT